MIKFDIKNRFTGNVQFTAEIDCDENRPEISKRWLAADWALENGIDLSGADLRAIRFSRQDLRGIDLSGADLRFAVLYCSSLRGANLSGADLREADLASVEFRGANLTGAKRDKRKNRKAVAS